MNPDHPPLPESDGEISSLIEALHATVHRLEELTEGEVDAVMDRQGRTILLGRAHERLRQNDAARQAAILNALPAHIALLDTDGVIISVNEAWRRFAGSNALAGDGCGVGLNYINICRTTTGDDAVQAQHVADGIHQVLDGRSSHFSVEYPCHAPSERRWFQLTVTPLSDAAPHGAVIMHLDITERKLGEDNLRRFGSAMDATEDAIYLVDRATMRFIHVNDAACRMREQSREELLAQGPATILSLSQSELERIYDDLIESGVIAEPLELSRRRPNGEEIWVELRRHAQRSDNGWTIVTLVRDITERKEAEQRLHHLAHFDTLTGLPNRTLFYKTLKRTLALSTEYGWQVGVLCIDLDHFKNVNDTLGHAIGDELLGQVSSRLVQCVRIRDTVGRLGGDEFAVILVLQDGLQGATVVAAKIRDALSAPFDLKGHEVVVSASIGITVHPDDASDPETLLKYADTAMYRAKHAGRDTFRFFTAQMNIEAMARLDLEIALRKAIENEEFVLHYQPKLQLDSGRVVGVEALLRWQRPGHGLVPPAAFISILEETGLIVRVGSWVINAACEQIARWLAGAIGPLQISVNVAGRQFIEGDLKGDVLKALAASAIPPDLLELELTESSLMDNTERTIACMQDLKMLGVQISIDDFGTGYSSLAYLRRFPIDKLKIDIAFIRDVTTNPEDAAIALAIIQMAHSLKLEVVAEGVETAAQLAYLRRHQCDQMQGYLFSRPLPLDQLELLLEQDTTLPPPDASRVPTRTLLLVDDEAHVLTSLQRLLRQDGYHILVAQSAAEGFELLALHPVQVILCDQRMPAMSGTVFLDRVKDLYPDTFRIVLSGYTDLESIMDAVNRGAIYRFYTKPWDNKVLRDNIREAFRHYWLLHDMPSPDSKLENAVET